MASVPSAISFTPVLAPDMRLSYRLHIHCAPLGQGAHAAIGFWSSVVEVVQWVVQINVLIFSQKSEQKLSSRPSVF